jgi:myxalamid-type polyketide synthase MxaE and MxaD
MDKQQEPIAVVGIGCRFPGSNGPEGFWQTLCEGKDTIGPIPKNRWDSEAFYDPDPTKRGKMVARTGGFLDDIEGFDWRAFRVSPREAKFMDPQHRLMLEVAWEAFEDAGVPFEKVAGSRTAVFVGIMWNDYGKLQALDLDGLDGYSASGNAFAFAANRISFFFDLKGPSVALDVSCASSLIAVHLACESIWSGESVMAVAGGVNLIIAPDSVIAMSKAGILSAEGHCKPFDASADGFVRGEGAGVVILKPLSAALADGDRIHALIRGTAAMHSGKTDWIMAPSSSAQEEVYRQAYRRAGVDPSNVDYVELHGTGTRKGDPLEARSVSNVMGAGSGRQGRCVVGSVKTNLGHLDSAAGIAGLIKTALALEHRRIPGSLNLKNVNQEIDLDALGLDFRTELGPWPAKAGTALAGVTGLSFGGGNVHIVMEEPPRTASEMASPEMAGSFVLPLSARSDGALRKLAGEYQALLRGGISPQPLCAAASLNRSHHPQRVAVTGRTASELDDALGRWLTESAEQGATRSAKTAPVFVFSGQGPQWWGMGRELAQREAVFRDVLERCDAAVRRHSNISILDELGKDEARSRVQETQIAQPVIFALQAALTRLLESWGVKPAAVVGHSVGEIAAAYVSGALSLEAAARIAAWRGRIMHAASHLGRMVQVGLSREEADALVEPFGARLGVAAENGPRSVVLSGETDAVEAALQMVKDRGASARLLPVRYAFHSAVMNRFQGELMRALEGVEPRDPVVPLVSTLLGRRPSSGEAFTPTYWANQMREPVEFLRAITSLSREGHGTFIEIGPHPVLSAAIADCLGAARDGACILPTLVRGEPERLSMLSTLAAIYSRGQDVAWPAVVGKRAWAPLPTYPWQKEKMWIERARVSAPAPAAASSARVSRSHPLLQASSKLARPSGACIWEAVLDVERMPYLRDHRVGGKTVVPASLFVEMAIAASAEEADAKRLTLRDVELLRALILPDHGAVRVQLFSSIDDSGTTRIEIWSKPESEERASFTLHVTAIVEAAKGSLMPSVLPSAKGGEPVSGADVYAAFRRSGEDYGAAFQGIQRLWREAPSSVLAELSAPRAIAGDIDRYFFHPALLDACMHSMAAAKVHVGEGGFMPTRFDRIEVVGKGGARLWARASMQKADDASSGTARASIRVFDDRGAMLLDIHGVSLQYLDELGARDESPRPVDTSSCYEVAWRPTDVAAAPSGSPSRFVVVSGGGKLTTALRSRLERDGHAVAVTTSFDGAGGDCQAVVFVAEDENTSPEDAAAPSAATTIRLIETVRTMTTLPSGLEPRLFVVTRDGQRIADEGVEPSQGLLWGLGRSIAAEYPSLWGGLIDVSTHEDVDRTAASLAPILTARTTEDQLAVRSGTYLAARLVPLSAPSVSTEFAIERDAAYLVTGGFGALGQTFARDLLARGAQHVVLMSRSEPSAEHAATLGNLSGLGGTVYHAVADVADEAQVRSALDKLRRDGVPEIRGVLHAAGTVLLQPITELDERDVEGLFRSKVTGTWVLDRIFASNLKFFVLFSSASAVLQSASLAAYAAANAYQDALAHARRARGQHALTVNWGPWAGEGMAKDTGAGRGPLGLRGMGAIDGEQGTSLLGRFLDLDLSQVSVLPIDWATFRAAYPSFDRSPFLSELGAGAGGEQDDERNVAPVHSILLAGGGKITRERIEQYLLDSAARALHASPEALSAESTLIELGLDSLMLVELRLEIERALGVRLRLMDLLSDPTIRELSKNLEPHVKEVA